MARIVGGISTSHIPAIGNAIAKGLQQEPYWKPFFDGAQAPFSWEPDQVEVLASGDLALSTGLVKNPEGAVTARFNSIWQRQADGRWQVIFDKGGPP